MTNGHAGVGVANDVVVALVVVVAVFDFNRLKPLITARVADFSGRQLEIGGDLNVRKSLLCRRR